MVSETARLTSAGSEFQNPPVDEPNPMNSKGIIVFRELPMMKPPENAEHWTHLADIKVEKKPKERSQL